MPDFYNYERQCDEIDEIMEYKKPENLSIEETIEELKKL